MGFVKHNVVSMINQPKEKTCISIRHERFVAQRIGIGEQDKRSLSERSFDNDILAVLNGDDLPVRR